MPPNGRSFSANEHLKDNNQDPDVNFYQAQISCLGPSYYIPNKVKENSENFKQKLFSVLHINICSMSKRFESLQEIYIHYISHSVLFVYWKYGASLTKIQIQIPKCLAK